MQTVIVNQNTGTLIDGHLRVSLALRRGEDTPVPFVAVDLTEQEEALILATLDPIGALATADKEKLGDLLADVETENAAVKAMLEELAKDAGLKYGEEPPEDPGAQIDKAAELQKKWGTALGQVWEMLGRNGISHELRIMSASEAHILCDFAVYDPPFDWTARQQDTALSWSNWENALVLGLAPCMPLVERADFNHWWVCDFNIGRFAGKGNKPMSGCCIALAFGDKRRWNATEALAILDRHEITHADWPLQVVKIQDSLWDRGVWLTSYEKPAALMEYIIALYSKVAETIGDPFAGGGGVLMASEILGRRYIGSEIDPSIAACALERYATAFAVEPVLTQGNSQSEATR